MENSVVLEALIPLILKTINADSAQGVAALTLKQLQLYKELIKEFCVETSDHKILIEEVEIFCGKDPTKKDSKSNSIVSI